VHGDQQNFQNMFMDYHQTVSKTSGRVEIRQCWAISDPISMDHIRHYEGWTDLKTIVRVERETRTGDKTTQDTAYYITSLVADAQRILEATRHHWAIENSFHWVLDVTFGEDLSRIRVGDSAENMAVLRTIALNLLKQNTFKSSLKQKRFRAAMNNDFLWQLLTKI